nr:K(+)-transporting ATPase subunit F [Serratia sp. PL17]
MYQKLHLWRCPVSISVIGGALLVLLLLGYLVYALFNAEDF